MLAVVLVVLAAMTLVRFVSPKRAVAARVETAQVRRGEIRSVVSATGTLAPVVTIQVGSQVSGTIQQLFATHNSVVKKGQVIAQIDRALFEARVEETRGAYLLAQGAIDNASAELADAKRALGRAQRLAGAGLVARAEHEAAETRHLKALAAMKSASGTLAERRGAWNQARLNLDYTTIRSPVDGIVIGKNVDVGQTVAAAFNTPTLFMIAQDLKNMEIDANVNEADIGHVRAGEAVTFTVDAFPGQRFQGKVNQVRHAPIVNHNVVTYIVVIGVSNDEMLFKPGMTANVEIETARRRDALCIPSAALRFKPKGSWFEVGQAASGKALQAQVVYVQRSERRLEAVPVSTGISNNDSVEVLGGTLKEGDLVVKREVTESAASGLGQRMTSGPPGPQF